MIHWIFVPHPIRRFCSIFATTIRHTFQMRCMTWSSFSRLLNTWQIRQMPFGKLREFSSPGVGYSCPIRSNFAYTGRCRIIGVYRNLGSWNYCGRFSRLNPCVHFTTPIDDKCFHYFIRLSVCVNLRHEYYGIDVFNTRRARGDYRTISRNSSCHSR